MVTPETTTRSRRRTKQTDQTQEPGQENSNGNTPAVAPKSIAVAQKGVSTGEDFAALMSALMSDVIEGTISPDVAHAACNAGGKLLKVVEMKYRYAKQQRDEEPSFVLVAGHD